MLACCSRRRPYSSTSTCTMMKHRSAGSIVTMVYANILLLVMVYASLPAVEAFLPYYFDQPTRNMRRRYNMYIGDGKQSDNNDGSNKDEDTIMWSSRLSHAMIRVPSVNATVDYWVAKGATVSKYNKSERGETAFVTLGNAGSKSKENNNDIEECFSLEITSLPPGEEPNVGNALNYIGTSMLLNFQNNLIGAAAGEKPKEEGDIIEPNGIEVRSVASGPGDYFARLCLRPRPSRKDSINGEDGANKSPLQVTEELYTQILGMRVVAYDNDLLCLRYKQSSSSSEGGRGFGVPTTLVFSSEGQADEELLMGNVLDHIVISTESVERAEEILRGTNEGSNAIFMEPRSMFGTRIMRVEDPNGYNLYLAEMTEAE